LADSACKGVETRNVKLCKPLYDWEENDVFRYFYDRQIRYCPVYDSQLWSGANFLVTKHHVQRLAQAALVLNLAHQVERRQAVLAAGKHHDHGVKGVENVVDTALCLGQHVHVDIGFDPSHARPQTR
jgi:3'-phosphoadenosine 5'-phosphosulfate sulfotransferase (PAPS reductase)/FAD synthetase